METNNIKQLANGLVQEEINTLRRLMERKADMNGVQFEVGENAPMLNWLADDGHYVNFGVYTILIQDDMLWFNVYLWEDGYKQDEPDSPWNMWKNSGDDVTRFIPGEITAITEAAEKVLDK